MSEQGVTVVVPTLDRGGFLLDCLRDLAAQGHRPLEILVVDQSDEALHEVSRLADEHAGLIAYCQVPFKGLPRARNYGWQTAKHDAIVFVDDDIRCGPGLVAEHLRALRLPGVGVVAGGIDEANKPEDAGPPTGTFSRWTATPLGDFSSRGEGPVDHAKGCNFSAWRGAIAAAGGFDERLNVGAALYEELDLCLRVKLAGFKIYFNGLARLTHLAATSGGCRVEEIPGYVRALAHNRGVLIRRHLRWFHVPVAVARVALLGLSYARHYRAPAALTECAAGCLDGLRAGRSPPRCTAYGRVG